MEKRKKKFHFHTVWFTDLDSLIRGSNLRIFLLLRFHVKSILVILEPQKLPFWLLSSSEFWIFYFFRCEIFLKIKIQCLKIVYTAVFAFWNQPKLILCKIRVAGKLLNFHTVEYPQSKFPIRLLWSVHTVEISNFSVKWNLRTF